MLLLNSLSRRRMSGGKEIYSSILLVRASTMDKHENFFSGITQIKFMKIYSSREKWEFRGDGWMLRHKNFLFILQKFWSSTSRDLQMWPTANIEKFHVWFMWLGINLGLRTNSSVGGAMKVVKVSLDANLCTFCLKSPFSLFFSPDYKILALFPSRDIQRMWIRFHFNSTISFERFFFLRERLLWRIYFYPRLAVHAAGTQFCSI